jgi:hypothetical protein
MVVFIGLVFVAYVYIWRSGGLDWERTERRDAAEDVALEQVRELARAG